MARLTKEQWAEARAAWEGDSSLSFEAIGEMFGVSGVAVFGQSKRNGWMRGNVNVNAEVNVKAHVNVNKPKAVKQVKKPAKPKPVATIEEDHDQFGTLDQLTDKQEAFVREYMVDWNATKAAIRAGYSPDTASQIGYQLLQKTPVSDAIKSLATARAQRLGIDSDEMLKMWAAMIAVDVNEISQLRRVCCHYCWGEDHGKQYTPSSLESAQKKHDTERAKRLRADENDDIGEFPEYADAWYDRRNPPHEGCPECHGEGIEVVFFNDTRNLSPAAKLLYSGVKAGRDGIEVLMLSREKAMDNLAKALGMFKDSEPDINVNVVASDELLKIFEEKMRVARERQAEVLAERSALIGEST